MNGRRLVIALLVLLGATATATASTAPIALKIEFRADAGSKPRVLTLRCGIRATGTLPRPAVACARLRRLGPTAFRPTPPGMACTEIYGGPSTARITGTYLGSPVWVRLGRANGCEIARWERVGFLLPRPGSP